MATARQIKALIESYAQHDPDRFLSVANQIAAHAARTGKSQLAADLGKLVEEARRARSEEAKEPQPVPIAQPTGELSGLVTASYPKTTLVDMVLDAELERRLRRVILEDRQADRLASHGLAPRRKLLLLGPPGCGKSMTATAIAGELQLPVLTVQFHALITKFMGETASKLHMIFDAMKRTRGVYLFDEFDAIGGHRHGGHDVGEIRRVLNAFLVFLEADESRSIVIAASNLGESLDHALFRRFDDVLRYGLPTQPMARRLIENRLAAFDLNRLSWKTVLQGASGMPHAEVVRACEDAAKDAVLDERRRIRTAELTQALRRRRRS